MPEDSDRFESAAGLESLKPQQPGDATLSQTLGDNLPDKELLRRLASNGYAVISLRLLARPLHPSSRRTVFFDPRFTRNSGRYFVQSGLAVVGMFAVLLLVDSLSDAAVAVGLGSSVLIVFVYPSNKTASPRSLIGGHFLALLVGTAFSLFLFSAPVHTFLEGFIPLRDLALATSVGVLIVTMAITDTEHPPAAGTVLGMSTRVWDLNITVIIIGAVLLLAVIKPLLHRYLHDLV